MSLEVILNGTFDYDPSAEKVRTAFDKVNNMFAEIYGNIPFDFTGNQGMILVVKATEDGFELAAAPGGGDMFAANNLSDLIDAVQARSNLGLGTAATQASSAFATAAQGTTADSALQSVQAGTGMSIDVTDPNNPILNNTETNDYVSSASFNPATGVLTLNLNGGGTVTVDLSAYTVLKIDGFQVEKGSGNTNYASIEAGDKCRGWDGDRDVAFRVDALPHTTEANRTYATDNPL